MFDGSSHEHAAQPKEVLTRGWDVGINAIPFGSLGSSMVEQQTLNLFVLGSSPSRGTTFFLRWVGFLICLWLGEVSSLNVRPES